MITRHSFGSWNEQPVTLYRLTNQMGAFAEFLDFGCTLRRLCVPDRSGTLTDVVLYRESAEEYATLSGHMGGTVGRVANRIAGAAFTLCGERFQLTANENGNCLHGGSCFDHKMWSVRAEGDTLFASYVSPDGEDGFPGTLRVSLRITFTDACELILRYNAISDRDTPVSLTNHAYFNLMGCGSILKHTLRIHAQSITPVDEQKLPLGTFMDVVGTPFDFRVAKSIGRDIDAPDEQLRIGGGYDHNFVLNGSGLREACVLEARNGIRMSVHTDAPCMQVYTANGLKEAPRCAVCLETQGFPNAVNTPNFPSVLLRAGDTYSGMTVYSFES